ncbi:MAG: hypothetical protein ACREJO_07835 [Phycisphaerales bacterium]
MPRGQRIWGWTATALIAAAVSLIVADVASCFRTLMFARLPTTWQVGGGCMVVQVSENLVGSGGWNVFPSEPRTWWWRHDFGNISGRLIWDVYYLPLWFLWTPLLALGLFAVHRGRRIADGQRCSRCGYSLAGLPHNVKCPECGDARR